jgi:hypothetical protein
VFENRVLRKTFGLKSDDVIGEWRRLHEEELYDLYPVIKSRRTRRGCGGGACCTYEGHKSCIQGFDGAT